MKFSTISSSALQKIYEYLQSLRESIESILRYFKFSIPSPTKNTDSLQAIHIIDRRGTDRRSEERRANDRRDTTSWRYQVWKRTSLAQYCRRDNDRRSGDRRNKSERRLAISMIES